MWKRKDVNYLSNNYVGLMLKWGYLAYTELSKIYNNSEFRQSLFTFLKWGYWKNSNSICGLHYSSIGSCCWWKTLCCQMLLSGGEKNPFSSSSDAQINLIPPHCNKNITIIKHLCQPKSIPKSFAPVGRPAANKALNRRETFLQLLIKYNTAKFHLQHIILIMGMEIIHSIAIQK